MTLHVSLDLETWGTEPGDDLRSIGACTFNPATGAIGSSHFYIATDSGHEGWHKQRSKLPHYVAGQGWRKYPLRRDPRTVEWWEGQSEEAQAAFADPVDLREALERFGDWLYDLSGTTATSIKNATENALAVRIWSHGAAFDPPILAAAFKAAGLPVPWHYRAPRDTRTIFDIAHVGDHSAWLEKHPGPLGIVHHALDDAICQANAICAAYAKINRWQRACESGDLNS